MIKEVKELRQKEDKVTRELRTEKRAMELIAGEIKKLERENQHIEAIAKREE